MNKQMLATSICIIIQPRRSRSFYWRAKSSRIQLKVEQRHPTTVFGKISVRISSYCLLRNFYTREGLKIYRLPFNWCTIFEAIGTLRSDDGDDNEDVKKALGLISKKTTLHVHHAFLYISLPSLHDYDARFFVHFFVVTARLRRKNA